jgi:hypothetical protein
MVRSFFEKKIQTKKQNIGALTTKNRNLSPTDPEFERENQFRHHSEIKKPIKKKERGNVFIRVVSIFFVFVVTKGKKK